MATDAQKQAAVQDFLSRFRSFNDPGALSAWNDLAAIDATSLAGFQPVPAGTDADGNITGYAAQSTKEAGAANGGNFAYDASGAFPGSGSTTGTSFNWTPPVDDTGGLSGFWKNGGSQLASMALAAYGARNLGDLTAGGAVSGDAALAPQFAGWSSEAAPGAVGYGADGVNYGAMFDGSGVNAAVGSGNMGAGVISFGEGAAGLSAAAAARGLAGGSSAGVNGDLGYGGNDVPNTNGVQAPKGYTLPDGSTVYGTPQQITDAANKGLIPGINTAAALKSLLGADAGSSGSALSRLLGLGQTGADALSVGGNALGTYLGYDAAKTNAQSLKDLSDKYLAIGAPSRARYDASFAPGFTMADDPGYTDALNQTAKASTNAMSVNFGNPSTSPNAWTQTLQDVNSKFAYPALQGYRATNANTGGFGTFNAAAPGVATGALQANTQANQVLGYGIDQATQPNQSLADLLKKFQGGGNNIFTVG